VVPHGYSFSFTIRPNDLREDRLPRDITESIHWLVSTRLIDDFLLKKTHKKLMFPLRATNLNSKARQYPHCLLKAISKALPI